MQHPRCEQEVPWLERPRRELARHPLAAQDENRPKRDKAPPDHPPGDEPKPAAAAHRPERTKRLQTDAPPNAQPDIMIARAERGDPDV
jgi:hypothetical protein